MEDLKDFEVKEDVRQSKAYGLYMEKIGWKTISVQRSASGVQIFVRRLGWVAIAKIQRVKLPLAWEEINQVLKENKVFMCKLEPNDSVQRLGSSVQGFGRDGWPLLGTKTLRVNLRPSEKKIMAGFKKDARYCIRQATSLKPQVSLNKFEDFCLIWKKSARRKNLWIPSIKDFQALIDCFGKNIFCVTAKDMAGAVILIHKGTAFYYYAGGTEEGNRLNLPYLVVWRAMKEAKKRGCKAWDFEGIYDSRWPNKRWLGFSHFKKSFGGVEVEYPGSFTKWRLPV